MRLWRERDFRLFWGGQAVSLTGSAVSEVALSLPVLCAVALLAGGAGVVFTQRARLTPDRLLGRVGASAQLMVFGALPVGSVVGGFLAGHAGNRPAMWIAALAEVASIALLLPLWRPDPPGTPDIGDVDR